MKNRLYGGLLCIALFCCVGCNVEQKPLPKWKVSLVRPDGTTHKVYTVTSRLQPKCDTHWGGQVELYSDDGSGIHGYESTGLIAPTGWLWESEKIRK